jgi:hypothetical protein
MASISRRSKSPHESNCLMPMIDPRSESTATGVHAPGLSSARDSDGTRNSGIRLSQLPVGGCVPFARVWGGGKFVCWGGKPEVPSTSLPVFGDQALGSHNNLSWRLPGGVRSTAWVNSKIAVRWPATRWRCSLSATTRRIRASARPSRSPQTRGGER